MRERTIETAAVKFVESLGGMLYKWNSANNSGVPDRILIIRDLILFIEFKRPGGKLTKRQAAMHRRINKSYTDQICYTVTSVDELKEILADYVPI